MIINRMIELGRNATARLIVRRKDNFDESSDEEDKFDPVKNDKKIHSPSMMKLYCNLLEVVRLRE